MTKAQLSIGIYKTLSDTIREGRPYIPNCTLPCIEQEDGTCHFGNLIANDIVNYLINENLVTVDRFINKED